MTTDQRVALVTGAARGQGWAITQRLRADGFFVAACDVSATDSASTDSVDAIVGSFQRETWNIRSLLT